MADGDDRNFTDTQIDFLQKFCSINIFFERKASQQKREAQEQEFRVFNATAKGTQLAIDRLNDKQVAAEFTKRLENANTVMIGSGGKTNVKGALDELSKISADMEIHELRDSCREGMAKASTRAQELLKSKTDNDIQIKAFLDFAADCTEKALASDSKSELKAGAVAVERLNRLMDKAAPGSEFLGLEGGAEKGRHALAVKGMQEQQKRFDTMAIRCSEPFRPGWPPTLVTLRDDAVKSLTIRAGDDADTLEQKTKEAAAKVTAFIDKAENVLKDHDAWTRARKTAASAITDLKAHKLASNTVYIAPEITKLDQKLTAGTNKATAFDYPGATTEVAGIPARVAELFILADSVAKLAAVRTIRENLVATSIPTTASTFTQVQTLETAVNTLLTEAQDAADNGRLTEAVTKFDQIPAAVEKAQAMRRHAKEYEDDYQDLKDRRDDLALKSGVIATAIATDLATCTTQLNDAQTASAADLERAVNKLNSLGNLLSALEARVDDVEEWLTDKQDFDNRLQIVKDREGDNGRVAIEDFYQRMLADKSRAEALTATGVAIKEWKTASKIVTATKDLHDDKIDLAVFAKDYLARKKELEDKIREVEPKSGAAAASRPIAGIRVLIANAAKQTTAKDWQGAVETLKEAEYQLDQVETIVAESAKVEEGRSDPALTAVATGGIGPAMAAYNKAKSGADAADADQKFQSLRVLAANKASQAQAAMSGTTPNPSEAQRLIGEAVNECGTVVRLVGERFAFNTMWNAADTEEQNLRPRDVDDYAESTLDSARQQLDQSSNNMRSSNEGYGAGIAVVTAVNELIAKAGRILDAYDDTATDRQTLEDAIDDVDDTEFKPLFDPEILRLKNLKTELENLIKNGEREKANAKSKEAAKLAEAIKASSESYIEARDDIEASITNKRNEFDSAGTPVEVSAFASGELKELNDAETKANALLTAKAFKAVGGETYRAYFAIENGAKKVTQGKAWEIARAAAETELKKLTARRPITNPFIFSKVDGLEKRYEAAVDQAGLGNFVGAKKRLDTFVTDCQVEEPLMLKFDQYRTARDNAGKAIAELFKVKNPDAIAPLVANLRTLEASAATSAKQGHLDEAIALLAEVTTGVEAAKKAAQEDDDFADLAEQTKAVPQGDTAKMKEQITKARELVKKLRDETDYTIAIAEIIGAEGELTAADKIVDTDTDKAGTHLEEAMRVCALARMAISVFAQLRATEDKSNKLITDFLAKPEATFVRDELIALQKRLDGAVTRVRIDPTPASRKAADDDMTKIMREFTALVHAAKQQVVFDKLKGEVEKDLANMDRHDQRFAMKDDIAAIRQIVATTTIQCEKHEHDNAIASLTKAQHRQEAALIKADMVGDKVPSKDKIAEILKREGGSEVIDEIVASLDDTAKKKVLRVAFEARYGCKLEVNKADTSAYDTWLSTNSSASDEEKEEQKEKLTTYPEKQDKEKRDGDLQKFYKVMADLPDSDTLDNDSMIEFEMTVNEKGSFYGGSKKRVTMREGKFGDSGIYGLGLKHELETTDPDSTPEDVPAISYFSWNTLHEVGHAVDDKKGFMNKNMGVAKYGGWQNYEGNTYPVAEAVATKFEFDAPYISEYLGGVEEPPIPEPLSGVSPEEWERRRVMATAWCDRARVGNEVWQSAALAKEVAINGICYQESYPGTWTSYPLSARNKGVSGYQFRAPGEWFAELYAAFHTGKLNKSHPAREWLASL